MSEQNKSIVFRFLGGPRDGQESRWDAGTPVNEAVKFWTYTEAGTVGQVFEGISPAAWGKIDEGGIEALEKMGTPPLHKSSRAERHDTNQSGASGASLLGTSLSRRCAPAATRHGDVHAQAIRKR